jgi:hypothetical protein
MSAGKYNINCEQGATFDRVITYRDANNSPINILSYSARMHVREYAAGPLIVGLSSSDDTLKLDGPVELSQDGANGNVRMSLSAIVTAALPSGNYKYDLEIESLTGQVTRLIEGKFTVVPEITR